MFHIYINNLQVTFSSDSVFFKDLLKEKHFLQSRTSLSFSVRFKTSLKTSKLRNVARSHRDVTTRWFPAGRPVRLYRKDLNTFHDKHLEDRDSLELF